ncbi:(2Fe-2S)-binding protein [Novosphingobium resinovorum]
MRRLHRPPRRRGGALLLGAGKRGERRDHHHRGHRRPVAERVLAAWDAHQVAQCGYCQPGQVMAAIALIAAGPVDDAALEATMNGNLCRCATYMRIRAAVRDAAQTFAQTVSA